MWQEKYDYERYECPVCSIPVTEENYDWVKGMCKKCSYKEDKK
jgi:hypothetical protein